MNKLAEKIHENWPELNYEEARATYETVHLWTQIVGKIKLAKLPWINHSWHVTLQVTPTGLSTADMPDGDRHFQIDFNFINHRLIINTSEGQIRFFELKNISVADFYNKIFSVLNDLKINVKINPLPSEIANVISFHQDTVHATYHPEHILKLHKALLIVQSVLIRFRSGFKGKCSPVHFFWGSFDLAVSRFSGRMAPKHPGGIPNLPDRVVQEAYSHEVSSCGFWPGNEMVPFAVFYSYVYPESEGFKSAQVKPEGAYYHQELREFILPYEAVRQSEHPEKTLLDFLHSTYDAAADLAQWSKDLQFQEDFLWRITDSNR